MKTSTELCPECGLINDPMASRCDCGHIFASAKAVAPTPTSEGRQPLPVPVTQVAPHAPGRLEPKPHTFRNAAITWAGITFFLLPRSGCIDMLSRWPVTDKDLVAAAVNLPIAMVLNGALFGWMTAGIIGAVRKSRARHTSSGAAWYFVREGQRGGPVDLNGLVQMLRAAPRPHDMLVWRDGLGSWTRARDCPDLGGFFVEPTAGSAAPLPATPAAAEMNVAPIGRPSSPTLTDRWRAWRPNLMGKTLLALLAVAMAVGPVALLAGLARRARCDQALKLALDHRGHPYPDLVAGQLSMDLQGDVTLGIPMPGLRGWFQRLNELDAAARVACGEDKFNAELARWLAERPGPGPQ